MNLSILFKILFEFHPLPSIFYFLCKCGFAESFPFFYYFTWLPLQYLFFGQIYKGSDTWIISLYIASVLNSPWTSPSPVTRAESKGLFRHRAIYTLVRCQQEARHCIFALDSQSNKQTDLRCCWICIFGSACASYTTCCLFWPSKALSLAEANQLLCDDLKEKKESRYFLCGAASLTCGPETLAPKWSRPCGII